MWNAAEHQAGEDGQADERRSIAGLRRCSGRFIARPLEQRAAGAS